MIDFSKIENKVVGYTKRRDELDGDYYSIPISFKEFIGKYLQEEDNIYSVYVKLNYVLSNSRYKDGKIDGKSKFSLNKLVEVLLEREFVKETLKIIEENNLVRIVIKN